ncbi:MAG: TolC family protein, partial [Planctomycetales bacterium]|nr:TolC family protein [Planctomycetales bacterium]
TPPMFGAVPNADPAIVNRQIVNRPVANQTEEAGQQVQLVSLESVPLADAIGPLTLDSAIAVSLDRNPALVALRATEPVAHAAYHVSEIYPWNPFVQVQVLPYARDKAGDTLGVNHYVWLMQTVELAHQRRHREASASAALSQVRWNIVQAELTNAAQTERLYFTALYQRELRDLANHAATLNEELQGVVARRFNAALATAAEQTTAKVAVRQSRRQAELAEANFRTALLALQRHLNLTHGESIALTGQFADFEWLPADEAASPANGDPWSVHVAEDFVRELAQQRPDVLAAGSGVGVAEANKDLARANQIQNVAIGPFYERDESGTVFAGFRTQMNLPVWDTGRPLTAQREAEENLQWITVDQLRTRAEVEARTAIERYERARRMLKDQTSDRVAFESAEMKDIKDQFAAGQADILNVYAVQNTLLQEQRTYFDLLNEVAQAAADVTLMAGLPPARLVTANREPLREPEVLPNP